MYIFYYANFINKLPMNANTPLTSEMTKCIEIKSKRNGRWTVLPILLCLT